MFGGNHRVLVHPGDTAGEEGRAGQEPDLADRGAWRRRRPRRWNARGQAREAGRARDRARTFSGLTAASRMAQAIGPIDHDRAVGGPDRSLDLGGCRHHGQGRALALRRAVTRFSPRLCRFLSSIFHSFAVSLACRRAAIRASSQSAIGSRQAANLGRILPRSAAAPPLASIPFGFVAKEGLVKLFPVVPAVDADELPQRVFVAALQPQRPEHPLGLVERFAPLGLGLAVERGVECHRDPDRQKGQTQPDPEQFQDHEQHDENRQGRQGREPFRKASSRNQLANLEE